MALTQQQLEQNIDSMQTQGASNSDIQGYLGTLSKMSDGTYGPKTTTPAQPNQPTDNRNILQKIGGAIYDPLVTMAVRPGQLLGEGIGAIASKVTGDPGYYQRSVDAANQPMSVPVLGTNVKPVNQETPESIAGEGIGTAALGVGSPLAGGALLGASGAMQNNEGAGSVAINAVVGAAVGKVGELGLKAAIPIISNVISKYGSEAVSRLESALPEYAKPALNRIISSVENKTGQTLAPSATRLNQAISDATPVYSPKLIGDQTIKEGGVIKGRTVVSTPENTAAGTELANVPGYDHGNTNLQNYQAVQNEIPVMGNQLGTSLKGEGVLRPPQEVMSVVKKAVTNASQNSLLLQKTDPIVVNYLRVAQRAIEQSDGTLEGEWNVRKILDRAYDDAGGKYGNNKGLDQIHRASRNALLDDMESKANNTAVKAAMERMKNLYNASDVLLDKAKAEGGSGWERFQKNHPLVKKSIPFISEGVGLGSIVHLLGI
jgi:hypothetical protein